MVSVLIFVSILVTACAPAYRSVGAQVSGPSGPTPQEAPIDGDRPHVGTGAHIVRPGDVQVEIGGQYVDEDGRHTFTSPVLVRVGVNRRFEARIGSDGLVSRLGTERLQGIGNTQLSEMIGRAGGAEEPYLSVMPVVTFGTASVAKGLGSGSTDAQVVLLAGGEPLERLHLEANYGAGFIGSDRDDRRASQQLITG